MLFLFANIIVLTFAAIFFWWLSGYDLKLTGENEKADRTRRGMRCGLTLLLVEPAFWGVWQYWRNDDRAAGLLYVAMMLPLALIWAGCISELSARGFNWLIDPEDKREFDPNKGLRDLDAIASLVKNGRKEAAIQLCNELKESGDASVAAMETMLEHLGVKQDSVRKSAPLNEAGRLRSQGKFAEAEAILKSLLLENPANVDAAMMLIRLYAQELRRTDQAMEVLRALEQQPYVSSGHVEFARRSIHDWSRGKSTPEKVEAQPESVDELLAQRYFGTAVEILEQKTGEQPQDFDLWMKFAEVYAVHCGNVGRAEKIVRRIETNPAFSPEQIQVAKTRLKEWREAGVPPR
jgi:tetratricopeptide (TPR) repeat protein